MVSYKSPLILKIKYEYCATDFITIDLISSRNKGRYQKRTIPIKAYERKMSIECLKKKILYPCVIKDSSLQCTTIFINLYKL